jgi:hypothetical protein
MLVKALIFGGDDGVLEEGRYRIDTHHGATFFAELANQGPVSCIDSEWDFGLIVAECVNGRELGIGDQNRKARHGQTHQDQPGKYQGREGKPAREHFGDDLKKIDYRGRCRRFRGTG